MSRPSICLVGPGNLGAVLARALHAARYPVEEIIARDRAASLRRARRVALDVGAPVHTLRQAALTAGVVWLCVPDDAIPACARALAARGDWRGRICLHSSGALTSDLLEPLRRRGAAVATLHPMQSFVRTSAPALRGLWFGMEGDAPALRLARRIVRDLGGHALNIDKRNKPLYHALGSFSSPMLVAVLALAERIAREAGIPARARKSLTEPILRRTLDNYFRHGAAKAFSGPLKRGDLATVRAHLASLARVPDALQVYQALVRSALRTLPVANRRAIAKLLR